MNHPSNRCFTKVFLFDCTLNNCFRSIYYNFTPSELRRKNKFVLRMLPLHQWLLIHKDQGQAEPWHLIAQQPPAFISHSDTIFWLLPLQVHFAHVDCMVYCFSLQAGMYREGDSCCLYLPFSLCSRMPLEQSCMICTYFFLLHHAENPGIYRKKEQWVVNTARRGLSESHDSYLPLLLCSHINNLWVL